MNFISDAKFKKVIFLKVNICIKILRFLTVKILYNFSIFCGIFSSKLKNKARLFFIKCNNFCVERYKFKKSDVRILLLLPHCLQNNNCEFRITKDIKNCKKCGRCEIPKLSNLVDEFGLEICIATGGTLARKVVFETKPDLILACACERDLSSGIFDAYPFVVYGVLNERPNGDCISTFVDVEIIKKNLLNFVQNKSCK